MALGTYRASPSDMNKGWDYRSQVDATASGLTLLDYLARRYGRFSRDQWLEHVRAGDVLVDGQPSDADAALRAGQRVVWRRPPWQEPRVPTSFAVLFRAPGLLAVAKPRGLPTMPGGGLFLDNTLLARVRLHAPTARPLHRLGRTTSGIVLFATTSEAYRAIARQWRESRVLKVYRALVAGAPTRAAWDVDVAIGSVRHPLLGTVHAASPDGKRAHSHVDVLEQRDSSALVDVRIATGRPHQVRIHLAASGHPLVGDPLYVAGGTPGQDSRALPGDGGYHLHARLLGFSEPGTGRWTEVECAPPPLLRG